MNLASEGVLTEIDHLEGFLQNLHYCVKCNICIDFDQESDKKWTQTTFVEAHIKVVDCKNLTNAKKRI